ncbi:MAG: HmuY family protein [Labilithrix sp.]|nr:HmuY family protein [Labilithrix sp.]
MVFNINSGSALALLALGAAACSNSAEPAPRPAEGVEASFDSGVELRVVVPESGRVHVKLAGASVVAVADPKGSRDWDLAFEGYEIFTNSGPSGGGSAAAFGPLDAIVFIDDVAPTTPFLTPDKPGGAFLDWYDYEGAPSHALWSRFHVYGVKDGDRLWKVQILGYYGQRDSAPVSALYRLRYAEITPAGAGPTQELEALDGTAGGPQGGPSATSECLDLAEGKRTMLAPADALASTAWHLCFRRQSVTVNGEIGGPRGIGAVDLEASEVATEQIQDVMKRTPESEATRFEAVTAASFEGKTFRGDRIVSVFGEAWLDRDKQPVAPARAAWVVTGADGKQKFLLGFASFEGATERSPGTIVMKIKAVKG